MTSFGLASYALAAIAFGVMAAVLLASHPRGRRAAWMIAAAASSVFWGAGLVFLVLRRAPVESLVALDAVHIFAWTAVAFSWLSPQASVRKVPRRFLLLGASGAFGLWAVLAASFAATGPVVDAGQQSLAAGFPEAESRSAYLALLGMALVGLLVVEQAFRSASEPQRRGLRLLCIGCAGIFVIDVFVYSQAGFFGGLIPIFWEGRGLWNAAVAALLIVALRRQDEWETELFVSRQVAFYTAGLVAVGGYLLATTAAGYLIRALGGEWGLMLEVVFLIAALSILLIALFSVTLRARAKVLIVKHFYRNKYDYREEWLRLTSALSRTGDVKLLAESGLDGVARILGSREGALYLAEEGGRYARVARLVESAEHPAGYDSKHPIVEFLRTTGWVIDSDEYSVRPDLYGNVFGHPAEQLLPPVSVVVPLDCQGFLQGFVVLSKPPEVGPLNFEDHDILKTAGRQVAVVLAQALAQEQLTATRQFEAVNKLATFLMHDLKNVVAQQELVVANAQRFRHRPEFVDDAIATVRSGAARMRKVLEQLKTAAHSLPQFSRTDVAKVLIEVRSLCADRAPAPQIVSSLVPQWVEIDRDKLISVLTHVIRNAQDATPATGEIKIELARDGNELVISVTDTGKGMDAAFVRDRLFRPFDSTKGASGMGIGAYQVRETVRAVGGDVEVESEPGVGTRFSVRLPLLERGTSLMLKQPAA